jgi:hypothetical protein
MDNTEPKVTTIFSKVISLLLVTLFGLLLLFSPIVAWTDGTRKEGVEGVILFGLLSVLFYSTYKQWTFGFISLIILSLWLIMYRDILIYFIFLPIIVLFPFFQNVIKNAIKLVRSRSTK